MSANPPASNETAGYSPSQNGSISAEIANSIRLKDGKYVGKEPPPPIGQVRDPTLNSKGIMNNVAVDVGEASIDAVMTHGETFVINAELVENGGMNVVDGFAGTWGMRLVAPVITFAVRSALDAATA